MRIVQYPSRSGRFRSRRKKVNIKKVGTLLTLIIFVIMVFASIRYFALFNLLRGSNQPSLWRPDKGERIQLLLVGRLDETVVSSTILSIPAEEDPVYILRLPPQTLLVEAGTEKTESLSEIFTDSGVKTGIMSLNRLFGDQLPIHYYVVYDVQALAEVIASIEGVEVELPAGFHVRHQDTDYVFAPGKNLITADNLMPFLASDSSYDLTAFWAEKSLLVAVFNEVFSLKHISYLVSNQRQVSDVYSTNMASRELAKFRDTFQALEWENNLFLILPGRWLTAQGQRYWSAEERLVNLTVQQILESMPPYDRDKLVIDLFNGNGVNGFAAKTASALRSQGFQTGRVSNAPEVDKTQIYYLPDCKFAALELAWLLDIEAVLLEGNYQNSENPVAIILGRDLIGGN